MAFETRSQYAILDIACWLLVPASHAAITPKRLWLVASPPATSFLSATALCTVRWVVAHRRPFIDLGVSSNSLRSLLDTPRSVGALAFLQNWAPIVAQICKNARATQPSSPKSRGAFAYCSRHSASSHISCAVALWRLLRLAEPPCRRFCQTQLARATIGSGRRSLAGSGTPARTSALHVAVCSVLVALGSQRPSTLWLPILIALCVLPSLPLGGLQVRWGRRGRLSPSPPP